MGDKIVWRTETRRLGELVKWEENPRGLTREEAERLKDSLASFGYSQLVEIEPDNTIIDGHQRDDLMLILPEYGADFELEVRVTSRKLTRQERKKYIAYKHKGANGHFSWEAMANLYEPEELEAWGWTGEELAQLGITVDEQEPKEDAGARVDEAGELQEQWKTEVGQIWQLGRHKLICGDCTDRAVVDRVTEGRRIDIVFTSPPYNRGTTTGGGFNNGGLSQQLTNAYDGYEDNRTVEDYRKWQSALLLSWWDLLTDKGAIYYNHRPRVQAGLYETPLDWNPGLPVRQIVIWHSGAGINFAPTHYRPCHEWIVIYSKPDFRLKSKGDSGVGDVWQFGAADIDGHPAPFPVDLPLMALRTTDSAIIYDPFSGSGTTLIACEQAGRVCRAVEISPAYVAVTLQRYLDTTGDQPRLIDS